MQRALDDVASMPLGDLGLASHDRHALQILAKSIYRELRQSGLAEEDVMSLAGELLSLVTVEVRQRRVVPPVLEVRPAPR